MWYPVVEVPRAAWCGEKKTKNAAPKPPNNYPPKNPDKIKQNPPQTHKNPIYNMHPFFFKKRYRIITVALHNWVRTTAFSKRCLDFKTKNVFLSPWSKMKVTLPWFTERKQYLEVYAMRINMKMSCCWVAKSCSTLRPHGLQHTRLLCPPLSPGVCSNSYPLSQWCYLTISSSATPFCLQ